MDRRLEFAGTEGYAQFDGLLTLPTPDGERVRERLQHGLRRLHSQGLLLDCEVDGGRTHCLAHDFVFPCDDPDRAATVAEQLAEVLESCSLPVERVESTLRMRRWLPGEEEQSLIRVVPGRGLRAVSRRVDFQSRPAVEAPKAWRRYGPVLAMLLGVIGFLGWHSLHGAFEAAARWDQVELHMGPYADYLEMELAEGRPVLRVLPSPEELRQALARSEVGSPEALVLEDLLRGRLRYRVLNEEGRVLGPPWTDLVLLDGEARLLETARHGAASWHLIP